ncbi:hypothetical protein [Psychrobacillus soli]|uniref:SbsC C-terminal domain-containing protein n=1 Tax=Psychrobacillus soli TaxID=1543965 RepID=A0A544T5H3_9BACI|nr:hypothetical protein [Psychrobacillus soli]TQR12704.1 hypothetical protein FG383_13230 [Psychrobacillus soli]
MNKRLLKQTAAAVLLTSSVLAFSPVALGATTVDQSFDKVKAELNKATTLYVYPSLEGELVPSSSLYATLNSAKKSYNEVTKAIKASKLSEKEKQAKLKELDALYTEKITKGLVPYIDAYNYATKYLDPIMKEIKEAEAKNDLAAVEKAYHKLSVQLKSRTSILYRFSGKASRDLLLEKYKLPADDKREELMVPVTIYMKVTEAAKLTAEGKTEAAQKVLDSIPALIERLPNPDKSSFLKELIKEVEKVVAEVKPTTPPVAGGGGGGGSSENTPTPQQTLNTKITGLATEVNKISSNIATAERTASNTLTVTVVNANATIAEFLGQGFYPMFTNQLGVTKVDGHDALSAEAVAYIASTISSDATTLADLKGKTINLPITVNNGSELAVTFSLIFK